MPSGIDYPCPIPLTEVLGQDRAISMLQASMQSGRIHHAWIFHGPQGVGKFTTALAFASTILDPTSGPNLTGEIEPDPHSKTQHLIKSRMYPDLHVITKELARFDDDSKIRERKLITIPKEVINAHLLKPASLAPTIRTDSMASKVFIVDEAELLDRFVTHAPVQNAILKTLEEPAPATVIILVTSSEDRLLATIRSRCQRVAFTPLDERAMHSWLEQQSDLDLPSEHRQWLLENAAGSPGQLIDAIETKRYEWRETIEPLFDQIKSGQFDPSMGMKIAGLVEQWARNAVMGKPEASKEAANKAGALMMFRFLNEQLRAILRRAVIDQADDKQDWCLDALDLVAQAERHAAANVQIPFVMENLVSSLACIKARV